MIIIGIVGPSGSGKSILAEKIKKYYGADCAIISSDSYFNDFSQLSLKKRSMEDS
jgi:uridine kinase